MKMNEHKNFIEKTNYYISKEIVVHLTLAGGKFYNGIVVDINETRLLILDRKLGEVYIPIEECIDIEPFTEKEVGE